MNIESINRLKSEFVGSAGFCREQAAAEQGILCVTVRQGG